MIKVRYIKLLIWLPIFLVSLPLSSCNSHYGVCHNYDEIESAQKEKIENSSYKYLNLLFSQQSDTFWEKCHPLFKDKIKKTDVQKIAENINRLQLKEVKNLKLIDMKLAEVNNNSESVVTNICGTANCNDEENIFFHTPPGIEKLAVVFFKIPTQPIVRIAALKLALHENDYKLINFDINPHKYKNKTTEYYEQLGDKWIKNKKILPSYIAYKMAFMLSGLGADYSTNITNRLREKLEELTKDQKLQNELNSWDIDGKKVQIINIDLLLTMKDISPLVFYVSNEKLGKETTPIEANKLFKHIENNYPELIEFEAVLFQAYAEYPSNSNKDYSVYRVPLKFN